MKKLVILFIALLSGCASSPFLDMKAVWQHDRGSDWMLRPEREWIDGPNNPRLHVAAGLEWENRVDCPYIASGTDDLEWVHIGCSKTFGRYEPNQTFNLFGEFSVVHSVDELSDYYLSTDRKRWQGHNPFMHLRGGFEWAHKIKCPVYATGKSIFQGAPFESESHAPDLYWSHFECGKRWGGK